MPSKLQDRSQTLFTTADQLWTNGALRPDRYPQPVLALFAFRQMEAKFEAVPADLAPTLLAGVKRPCPDEHLIEQLRVEPWLITQLGIEPCPAVMRAFP